MTELLQAKLQGEEFAQLRYCVWDALGFVAEQLRHALTPSDQFAAIDAARGAIHQLQSRLARDNRLQAQVALSSFGPYIFDPFWQDRWADLASLPASDFANKAGQIIEHLEMTRECIQKILDSD